MSKKILHHCFISMYLSKAKKNKIHFHVCFLKAVIRLSASEELIVFVMLRKK